MSKFHSGFRVVALLLLLTFTLRAETPRETIAKAIVTEDSEAQMKMVTSLTDSSDPAVTALLKGWAESNVYIYEQKTGEGDDAPKTRIAVTLEGEQDADGRQAAHRVSDGKPITDAAGKPLFLSSGELSIADSDASLAALLKNVIDLSSLSAADSATRKSGAVKLGMNQDPAMLKPLLARQKAETDPGVSVALREAIDLVQLKSEDPGAQTSAAQDLGEIQSVSSHDFLEQLRKDSPAGSPPALAAIAALKRIDAHLQVVNAVGTVFRGASLGSVLLIMAIGLAITFGLMGVINMAHGELIAVGAYTTYVVQNVFGAGLALSPFGVSLKLPGMHLTGGAYESYFVFALPLAFLVSALIGILLERCVIRFLYRRPLESLLATWGVSLVLQQLLRFTFGASNVQVSSPSWLSGSWTVNDVGFGWNRLFVIGFAIFIVVGTSLLLTRTPLGLLIRAVTQNRAMAACMGVRTERVNMLTFGFGSGLAGLAGAFYSQLGNVGPSMGQQHIVSAFMTVVVGGLGSLLGTIVSAVGIGVADQSLQSMLEPEFAQILVLGAVIIFFLARPSGLFVTKSRNLEG